MAAEPGADGLAAGRAGASPPGAPSAPSDGESSGGAAASGEPGGARRPRWRPSLRWSITIGATSIMVFALVITALAVSGLLRRSITTETEVLLVDRVDGVAQLAAEGRLPTVLEPTGREVGQVQVIDASGEVVSSTPGIARTSRFDVVAAPAPGRALRTTVAGSVIDDDPGEEYVLVARAVTGSGDGAAPEPLTVWAVTTLAPAVEAQRSLQARLLVVLPLLALVTGIVIHQVVRRAMRPVESMRSQVERISASDLSTRVVPPESDADLARLGGTLNDLLARLEDAGVRQELFAASASHELRSPLSAIRTDLEVGLAYPGRTDWERTATDVLIEIARLEELSRDLRQLTRRGPGAVGRCDLGALVEREVAHATDPRVELAGRPGPAGSAVVALHDDEAVRIVRNLVDNARRHAATFVRIGVAHAAGRDGVSDAVTLSVSNDGPPIPVDERERVFEPFTRLDEARSLDAGGSGLGLAIVRSIARAAGGSVEVAPRDDLTEFVVTLPARAPAGRRAGPRAAPDGAGGVTRDVTRDS